MVPFFFSLLLLRPCIKLHLDERHGLENAEEIRKIMKKYRCNFDQARLIQQQNKMKANGIDPRTGVPIDPKAVYFS